jgi:predicted Zn-dependent protease
MVAAAVQAAPIDEPEKLPELPLAEPSESSSPAAAAPSIPAGLEDVEGLAEVEDAKRAFLAGDLKRCQEQLRAAFAKRPNLPPPKIMLARLLLSANQVGAGRRLLEDAAVSHATHPDVYLLLAQLALVDGHIADAAAHFEKASTIELPDNWTPAQRLYFKLQYLSGQTAVAQRRGAWDQAAELYQERVNLLPEEYRLRDEWAMALFRAGKRQEAYEQFDIVHRQDAAMNRPEVSMAVMCVQAADYRGADRWFEAALEAFPREAPVHLERSIALLFEDRAQEAEKFARQAAQLGMDSPLLHVHRGRIALQQGDYAAAEKFLQTALDQSPKNSEILPLLTLALVEQDDQAKRARALSVAEEAFKLRPHSAQSRAVLGWVCFRTRQFDKAKPLLAAAAAQPPGDPLALYFYAQLLLQQEKQEEAYRVADALRARVEQPGLFPLRPEVRKWLEKLPKSAQ